MNGLHSLIREVIQRLNALEQSESLKMLSTLDEHDTLVGFFPIQSAISLKEAEDTIENNSVFKGKLASFIFKYYFINCKIHIRYTF